MIEVGYRCDGCGLKVPTHVVRVNPGRGPFAPSVDIGALPLGWTETAARRHPTVGTALHWCPGCDVIRRERRDGGEPR